MHHRTEGRGFRCKAAGGDSAAPTGRVRAERHELHPPRGGREKPPAGERGCANSSRAGRSRRSPAADHAPPDHEIGPGRSPPRGWPVRGPSPATHFRRAESDWARRGHPARWPRGHGPGSPQAGARTGAVPSRSIPGRGPPPETGGQARGGVPRAAPAPNAYISQLGPQVCRRATKAAFPGKPSSLPVFVGGRSRTGTAKHRAVDHQAAAMRDEGDADGDQPAWPGGDDEAVLGPRRRAFGVRSSTISGSPIRPASASRVRLVAHSEVRRENRRFA